MNYIGQIQLLELIILFPISHFTVKRIMPKIDIPFLGSLFAVVLQTIFYIFVPPLTIIWGLLMVVSAIILFYVYKHAKRKNDMKRIDNSLSKIAWPLALGITSIFLAITLLLPQSQAQPNSENIHMRDKLATIVFQGEDNFGHLNFIQSIDISHKSNYFLSNTKWNPNLFPGNNAYPQLSHIVATNAKTLVQDAYNVVGKKSSDVTNLLWAYVVLHFFFVSCVVAIAVSLVISIIRKYKKISQNQMLAIVPIISIVFVKILVFPILNYGFFSQSTGLIALLLVLLFEIELSKKRSYEVVNYGFTLMRGALIIAVGHTWWLLSPIVITFISIIIFFELIRSLKMKLLKRWLLSSLLFFICVMISLIPAIVQLFVKKQDAGEIIKLAGPIQTVGVKNVIILLSLTFIVSALASYFSKIQRYYFMIISLFCLTSLICLLSIAIYQKNTVDQFSYYSYKLAWSVLWLPCIALFIITILVLLNIYELSKKYLSNFHNMQTCLYSILLIMMFPLAISAISTEVLFLKRTSNQRRTTDFLSAIDTANTTNKILITMSDCGQIDDYSYQKAAAAIQAKFTPESLQYFRDIVFATDIEDVRKKLVKDNTNDYLIYDSTPLIDTNPPSLRLNTSIPILRTGLQERWSTEYNTPICSTDRILNTP